MKKLASPTGGFNNKYGMSIIEVMVAVVFVLIAGTGLIIMALTAGSAAISAKYKSIANKLAKSSQEYYRGVRDEKGWDEFIKVTPSPCLTAPPYPTVANITPPIFHLNNCFSVTGNGGRQITTDIIWQDKGKEQKVTEILILDPWQ